MTDLSTVVAALRREERELEAKLAKIRDAVSALTGSESPRPGRAPKKARKKRKPLTAAQRKAISERMKASWAKRKKKAKKGAAA